jgi:hypothetical protein
LLKKKRRRIMLTKSKIAVIAAVLGSLSASPAFAQAFDNDYGTGNEVPTYYDSRGGLHLGNAPARSQVAAHRSGLNAFASIGRSDFSSDQPSATGGGSVGYNEMLQQDQW